MVKSKKFEYFSEYAEQWLTENGYSFTCVTKYKYKTKYKVSKDGVEMIWSCNDTIRDYKVGIEQFQVMFDLYSKIHKDDNN